MRSHPTPTLRGTAAWLAARLAMLPMVTAAAALFLGCANTGVPKTPPQLPPASPCQLMMYVTNADGADIAVEAFTPGSPPAAAGVCVKATGGALEIPTNVAIRFSAEGATDTHKSLCVGGRLEESLGGKACYWNRAFRSRYPLTFSFVTKGESVAEYARLIRVFQNGRLAYLWNAASGGASVVIPAAALRDTGLPYDAPMSLQIVPAGIEIDESALNATTITTRGWAERSLGVVGRFAVSDLLLGDPELKAASECFKWQLANIVGQVESLAQGGVLSAASDRPDKCVPKSVAVSGALRAAFDEAKTNGETSLAKVQQNVSARSKALSDSATSLVKEAAKELRDTTDKRIGASPRLAGARADVDALLKLGDSTADALTQLGNIQRDGAARIGKLTRSPEEQAAAFARLAKELEAKGSPFQQLQANPPLASGELSLPMGYREKTQFFSLAPWSAVPVRVAGTDPGAELQIANLVPVIDIGGVRYQWASSRFAEFRVGGGVLYFPDKVDVPLPPDAAPNAPKTKNVFNFGLEANMSIGTFRVGCAWVPAPAEGTKTDAANRVRVLVGVDLVKLLSGENAEAF